LEAARNCQERVVVDFSTLTFSTPTAMLVAGSELRKWVAYRRGAGLEVYRIGIDESKSVHSYLMHLGFFDFIHVDEGKKVGEARGSTRYLPISKIDRPVQSVAVDGVAAWYESIESQSRRLAGVLVGSYDDSQELRAYTYSIREIIRNVFEHSEADECFVCGQRWWNGSVEIAVIDEGVGICQTLRRSFPVESDEEALTLAISPGVSRTTALEEEENIYDNSGFGLYVLSQIGSNFGWFALGSGGARIIGYERAFEVAPFSFSGTFVGIKLERSPSNFRELLSDIISSGEDEAREAGRVARASGMSRFV
jgi:hypothetical protein